MNNVDKYRKIVNGLVRKSFPKLKDYKIILTEGKILNARYSAVTSYFIFFSWIHVHPKVRNYSDNAIESLFAHELAHIDLIVNINFFQKIKFAFSWLFTKKGKEKFERDADILTVRKGYDKGLIKLKEESRKTYAKEQLKKRRKGYLTTKEIKKLKNDTRH